MFSPRWLCLASFCLLLFEIALTRLLSYLNHYHFVSAAVSLALSGMGAGGLWTALAPAAGERRKAVGYAWLGAGLSMGGVVVLAASPIPIALPILGAAAALPFVFLGRILCVGYQELSPAKAYPADLLGAAAACAASAWLLGMAGAWELVLAIAAVAAAIAAAFLLGRARALAMAAAAAGLAFAGLVHTGIVADPLPASGAAAHKPLFARMRAGEGVIEESAWNLLGRVDVFAPRDSPNVRMIYVDASNATMLVHRPDTEARARTLRSLPLSWSVGGKGVSRVLVLGSGGGLEVELARLGGVRQVDAVEINSAIVQAVRGRAAFAGPVYDRPGVTLAVEDGRRFLTRPGPAYDRIVMALTFTATAQNMSYALVENYLHTLEAYRSLLSRLAPRGLAVMIDDAPERNLRSTLTALRALSDTGLTEHAALRRIAVLESSEPGYRFYLAFGFEDLAGRRDLLEAAMKLGLKPLLWPDVAAVGSFRELRERGATAFSQFHALDIRPRVDDSPFFFDFAKGGRARVVLLAWPGAAVLAGLSLMIILARGPGQKRWGHAAYFGAAGMGFSVFEMALLQRLTLVLGNPVLALLVVVPALLGSCAVGSALVAPRLKDKPRALRACLAATAAGIAAMSGLGPASTACAALGLGVLMGTALPVGLSRFGAGEPARVATYWAINSLGWVVGSALALATALQSGVNMTFCLAAVCYAVAACAAIRR